MKRALLAVALLLPPRAQAQPLRLATWNLDWLSLRAGTPALPRDVAPRDPADYQRLAAYAAILAADVVAFQEVDGPEVAARLFPPARYNLHLTADQVVQRVGLAIRRDIPFDSNPDVTALDVYGPTAAHPLRSGADVTLHLPGNHALRILAIHLKTGCWDRPLDSRQDSCRALQAQLPPLAAWIAARQAERIPFAVLGDFNRVMDGKDPFLDALRQAAPLLRVEQGLADPCWSGGAFIDHILLGGDAIDWAVPNSLQVLVYRETDYRQQPHLSDHCPIAVSLEPALHKEPVR